MSFRNKDIQLANSSKEPGRVHWHQSDETWPADARRARGFTLWPEGSEGRRAREGGALWAQRGRAWAPGARRGGSVNGAWGALTLRGGGGGGRRAKRLDSANSTHSITGASSRNSSSKSEKSSSRSSRSPSLEFNKKGNSRRCISTNLGKIMSPSYHNLFIIIIKAFESLTVYCRMRVVAVSGTSNSSLSPTLSAGYVRSRL